MGIDAEMLVRTKEPITNAEVLAWSRRLVASFGEEFFWFCHPRSDRAVHETPRHCLAIVDKMTQDGPDIYPGDGERFIRVYLTGRYYGVGYERGDLPKLIAIASWLEANIPGSSIWYGGDSSGVVLEPFGVFERAELFRHFCRDGREPFFGIPFGDPNEFPMPLRQCELCQAPLVRYGSGHGYGSYRCNGCGFKLRTNDGGKSWTYWFGQNEERAKPLEANP